MDSSLTYSHSSETTFSAGKQCGRDRQYEQTILLLCDRMCSVDDARTIGSTHLNVISFWTSLSRPDPGHTATTPLRKHDKLWIMICLEWRKISKNGFHSHKIEIVFYSYKCPKQWFNVQFYTTPPFNIYVFISTLSK